MVKILTFSGLLCLHEGVEGEDILYLSSLRGPLAKELGLLIRRKNVTARYWITDKQCTKDEAVESTVAVLAGNASCDFGAHYSELTGYLWTDEYVRIGGHDLIAELRSHAGKWVLLEIEVNS